MPRFIAEWEAQDGVAMSWPHQDTDWGSDIELVGPCFAAIAAAITQHQRLLLFCPAAEKAVAQGLLQAAGARLEHITWSHLPYTDTWIRDYGPLTVEENGKPLIVDCGFNGWGLKFPAADDNQVTRRAAQAGLWRCPVRTVGMIVEGGSLESDGQGTLLTTSACLLSPNRNPHLDRVGITAALREVFGIEHLLWLEHGGLEGDDTDAHVDTLARICPNNTILFQGCQDQNDSHFPTFALMHQELQMLRSKEGKAFRLLELPWPGSFYHDDGHRLPATYANYLIVNGAVLVPTYGVPVDAQALAVVAQAFPQHCIHGIDCQPLIRWHGSLHCSTMQLPLGTLA